MASKTFAFFGLFASFAFHCEQTSFENKTALGLLVLPYGQ